MIKRSGDQEVRSSDSLIPHSLIPDSQRPDSLIPDRITVDFYTSSYILWAFRFEE